MPIRFPLTLVAAVALLLTAGACESEQVAAPAPAAPPPTYRGPDFLRGSIGSLVTLRGYNPVLVSGYGLVVNLDGTGSADVPPVLRERFINELGKRGFGSSEAGFGDLSPSEVLNSDRTAIVKVEGVVPPGATKGTPFDLRVEALTETQTLSLANGTLYTTELSIGGADLSTPSDLPIARGRGPIFLNPFDDSGDTSGAGTLRLQRVGRVLAGGVSTADMPLHLILTRPSYRMSRMIADRINARFPPQRGDDGPIANPKSDTLIVIAIPERLRDDPQRLLDLCSHLFLNPTSEFNQVKAQELAQILADPGNAAYADSIAYAWEGMGKTVLPILQPLYNAEQIPLRLAALQAGARLGDTTVAEPLFGLAQADGANAEKATVLLGEMLKQRRDHVRVMVQLRQLLNASDPWVRMAAFEALAAVDDVTVRRFGFGNKCEIAQVKADTPMIYVSREGKPRIVVFDESTSFRTPLMFTAWDGQFMLRQAESDPQLAVYYRPTGHVRGHQESIPANLGFLAGVMAFDPDQDSKTPGLDMTYSQIVSVLYQLSQVERAVDAPFVLQRSRLEEQIARSRITTSPDVMRPETGPPGDLPPGDLDGVGGTEGLGDPSIGRPETDGETNATLEGFGPVVP